MKPTQAQMRQLVKIAARRLNEADRAATAAAAALKKHSAEAKTRKATLIACVLDAEIAGAL